MHILLKHIIYIMDTYIFTSNTNNTNLKDNINTINTNNINLKNI